MLTAVGIHPGRLHHVTIGWARWPAQVGRNHHNQEQRAVPLVPAVWRKGHDPRGRVRSGGTAELGLRAGNEVT